MTPHHTASLLLTLECGSDIYQVNREPETELVNGFPVAPLIRHWLVYKFNKESGFAPCPEALPLLVRASGADVVYHSADEFHWTVAASGERFWAARSGPGWLIDSCEGGGVHWYACDGLAMELALGLRTPSGHSTANRKPGNLRVAQRPVRDAESGARSESGAAESPESEHAELVVVQPAVFTLLEAWSHAAHC